MATVTPNYSWPVPQSSDLVKDGAVAIEALGDAIDATVFGLPKGLTLVKSQVIGSAVSSVAVTSAFSTTYDAYKIIVVGGVASADGVIKLSLTGGTSVYSYSVVKTTYLSTSLAAAIGGPSESSWVVAGTSTTSRLNMNVDLLDPFLAKFTTYSGGYVSSLEAGAGGGIHKEATSFTGFTLTPNVGTLTGGTIYVYGYAKV